MKDKIFTNAVQIAFRFGYRNLTRSKLAKMSKCAPSLINHYFGDICELREKVITYAIEHEVLPIVAEAIVEKRPIKRELRCKVAKMIKAG